MRNAKVTGRTLKPIKPEIRSCKQYDIPIRERVKVKIGGDSYERTVYERRVWRNMDGDTTVTRFVIVNGTYHEIA